MKTEKPEKKPPNARGQGRKSLSGDGNSPLLQCRVSPEQLAKYKRIGGPDWLRAMIDNAQDGDTDGT